MTFKERKMEKNEKLAEAIKKMQEAKKPEIVKELKLGDGEKYLGDLKNRDKYQVLARHLSSFEQKLDMTLQFESIMAICLEEIAKKQGIEIDRIINHK